MSQNASEAPPIQPIPKWDNLKMLSDTICKIFYWKL